MILTFHMTHFSTVFPALHDWFQQFQRRPCGRQIGFSHCPAIALIVLSWFVALDKAHYFHVYWERLSFNQLVYLCFQKLFVSLNVNFSTFYAFGGYFTFLLLIFGKLLEQSRHFVLKMDSGVCSGCMSYSHKHQRFTFPSLFQCNLRCEQWH